MVEATFIITMAILWFHVPFRGSFATLYAGIVLFLLAAIGVGLMISSLAVTLQQGLLGAFLFLVPAIILSRLHHAHRQHAAAGAGPDASSTRCATSW